MARIPGKGPGPTLRAVEAAAEKRKRARQSPFESYAARPSFDFADLHPATVCDGLHHALARGVAVTLSMTADGGAVKLSIWVDNQKYQAYAGDAATLNALFEALQDVEEPAE